MHFKIIDWLTMVSYGGKSKTDSFARVLMKVYNKIEIPFPVSHLKPEKKLVLNEFKALLSLNCISCCAIQHVKTNQEMELMTCDSPFSSL